MFFYSNKTLPIISNIIFKELNIVNVLEGENSSYLNNSYYMGTALGINIQIAENNYDYEDDFNFMISIKKSIGLQLRNEDGLYLIALILASIIAMKLNIKVAIETYSRDSSSNYLLQFSNVENELLVERIDLN